MLEKRHKQSYQKYLFTLFGNQIYNRKFANSFKERNV
jgi:hypothetical protein